MTSEPVMVAVDVGYTETGAVAAAACFRKWAEDEVVEELEERIDDIAAYEPGAFYRRELPCLIAVLRKIRFPIELIIIDGYVTLGEEARPGLGFRLWELFERTVPIIGVAKTRFHETPVAFELLRRGSSRPLYISSAGIELFQAKDLVHAMHGEHRIPTLLKRVDRLSRSRSRCPVR